MYADSSRRPNKRVGNYAVIKFMQGKTSWGLGRGTENFSILSLKMATFSAFWELAHVARGAMAAPLGSASAINHRQWQSRV